MKRALSTRSCAGRTHVGAVSHVKPDQQRDDTTGGGISGKGEPAMKLFYSPGACSLAERTLARPAVQAAMKVEGWANPVSSETGSSEEQARSA